MPVLDQIQTAIANVSGATAGKISQINIAEEGSSSWKGAWSATLGATPVAALLNTRVQIAAIWENTGTLAVKGRVSLTLIKPGGTSVVLTAVQGQDTTIQPGQYVGVIFSVVQLNEIGQYTLSCKLESI